MKGVLVAILLSAGVLFLYVDYLQKKGIYFPAGHIELLPSSAGLSFEDVYLDTPEGIKINGWFIPCAGAKYTLLFLHGNAGNIQDRIEKIVICNQLGLSVFIVDYRGYGRSQGKPSEKGLYIDAKAAYDYLLNKRGIKAGQIILYGESLGTAVAVDLASKDKTRAVILEGAFSSGKDMARAAYPFLPSFMFSSSFNSLAKIQNVPSPVLFIHSRQDEIVPFGLAKKLYDAAKEPKQLAEITGGHNTGFQESRHRYIAALSEFIGAL